MTKGSSVLVDGKSPAVLGLLVCDTVIEDSLSKKRSLIGLFDTIWTQTLPARQNFYVVMPITNVLGSIDLVLKIETEGAPVAFEMSGTLTSDDRNKVHDIVFDLRGTEFTKEAIYWVKVYLQDAEVCRRPLSIVVVDPTVKGN